MSSSQHSVIADARTGGRPRLSLLLIAILAVVSSWLVAAGQKLGYLADDSYILFRHVLNHSRGLGMVWDSWHPAVSYTHLDVYKRQSFFRKSPNAVSALAVSSQAW